MTTGDVSAARDEEGGLGLELRDVIVALRRRWWLIALLAFVLAGVAALVALAIPNRYEALATIQIDPRKKTIVQLDAVIPDITGDAPTIESQIEFIHSRDIALKVIAQLDLRRDAEFNSPSMLEALRQGTKSLRDSPRSGGRSR
jgi:uncharacterized protein involved in exopolysaccharide biosynthesis